jgi:hypothetical protein
MSVSLEATYTGNAGEQSEDQLETTVQYRWKYEYDTQGTVTTSSPAVGNDGWSAWGESSQATASGTFNQAGPKTLTITVEARVVDSNNDVVAAAVSGTVSTSVDCAGIYAVEAYKDGAWQKVGSTFPGLPSATYQFRALNWPLTAQWGAGMPAWTVAGVSAGTGAEQEISMPATVAASKAVTVTDGTTTLSFSAVATAAYAKLDEILGYNTSSLFHQEWDEIYHVNELHWEGDGSTRLYAKAVKDNAQLDWYPGYPQWSMSYSGQSGSGETFEIHWAYVPTTFVMVTCQWGPSPDEVLSFPLQMGYDWEDDLQVWGPCIPKGHHGYLVASEWMTEFAYWGEASPFISLDYCDQDDRQYYPLQPDTPYRVITPYAISVGESTVSATTAREIWDIDYPENPSASINVRVFDVTTMHVNCGPGISQNFTDSTSSPYYVPAYPGTLVKHWGEFDGLAIPDRKFVRLRTRYYACGSYDEVWVYNRAIYDSMAASVTITDPGTYDFGIWWDVGLKGGGESVEELVLEAVGVDQMTAMCKQGTTYLAGGSCYDQVDERDVFFAWPDKTGASVSLSLETNATATHDQWPSGKPVWGGCSTTSGTAGTSNEGYATSSNTGTISAPSTHEVAVECGTTKRVRFHAVLIDLDIPGVSEAQETNGENGGLEIEQGSTDIVALSIDRSPAALDGGTVRITCTSTSSAFTLWSDATATTTRFPSASFPSSTTSVDISLGTGTTLGDALPSTIYLKPSGTSFSTSLTIQYRNPSGTLVDSDTIFIHPPMP